MHGLPERCAAINCGRVSEGERERDTGREGDDEGIYSATGGGAGAWTPPGLRR